MFSYNFAYTIYCTKDVHRRQKLMTDFFKLFELTILVVTKVLPSKLDRFLSTIDVLWEKITAPIEFS